ncbi:AIM24 family protein, partial [Agromyces salentinus]
MFEAEMNLEFTSVKGIKNKFFGDSLFLAEIHGPGRIWLQSMSP